MISIDPEIPYNSQRGDMTTDRYGLKGNVQCMANTVQNLWHWVGLKFPDLFANSFPLTREGGKAYYDMMESRVKAEIDLFVFANHAKALNEAMAAKNVPLVCAPIDSASPERMAAAIEKTRRPIGFGIAMKTKGGQFRHIRTATGADTARKVLRVDDPYGRLWSEDGVLQFYRSHDGRSLTESFSKLRDVLTSAWTLVDR